MANMDKLILWGAAAVMAAVGSLSVWKISQEPTIDPEIAKAAEELTRISNDPVVQNPPPPVLWGKRPDVLLGPVRPANDWAGFVATKAVGIPVPPVPKEYFFLPVPVPGEAKADLDKMVVTWTLAKRSVNLKDCMIRKDAPPTGFIIQRQCEDGPVEVIGKVGPKETSFTDLSTEPRLTYRYWVVLTGNESDPDSYPPVAKAVTKGLPLSVEARTPAATRMKLIGGAKDNGILRAETYDRAQKKWVGKLVQTAPGRAIGSSGWTLKGLRFDNFTLVADVTDDEGVDRVLTTKD